MCYNDYHPKYCVDKLKTIPENTFSIHGLWPSYKSGAKIEACSDSANVQVSASLYEQLNLYWPSFKGSNQGFWNYQFKKHGYCFSTNGSEYLAKALEILNSKPYKNLYKTLTKQNDNT